MNHRDVLIRSLKTALVAFLTVFAAGLVNLAHAFQTGGLDALQATGLALAVSSIAAAGTALLNYAIQFLKT